MKKSLCILSAALIVASSCSKYEQPVEIESNKVKMVSATINAQSAEGGSKTSATKEGDFYKIKWTAGDTLSVFNSVNTDMSKFKTQNTGASAKFEGEIPEGSEIVAAIYPYYEKATISADKETVYTNVPTEQTGAFNNVVLAGWPKSEEDEMTIAETYDFKYQFEAVCGIVKFSFDPERIAEGKTITSISLTADQPLCGDAKISYPTESKPVLTPNPNATGSNVYNTITIEKKDGFTAGDYYFATFPINANGDEGLKIVIRFETSTGDVAYKQATLKAVGEEGSKHILAANIVKNIGTVKVDKYDEITGLFSVAKGKKVYFSPGNLQYQASTETWRFALNQWDAQGEIGNLTRPTGMTDNGPRADQSEWIDLFPWGHTGRTISDNTYYPYHACPQYNTYFTSTSDLANTDGDWGHYCDIINGNKVDSKGTWRLLTFNEYTYLINNRTCSSIEYTDPANPNNKFTINFNFLKCGIKTGVNDEKGNEIIRYGIMLFPDTFTWPSKFAIPGVSWHASHINNVNVANENAILYSLTEFSIFEAAGVIFLPSAGKWHTDQNTFEVSFVFVDAEGQNAYNTFNTEGYYWTSSKDYMIASYRKNVLRQASRTTAQGGSVRLVKNGEGW